MFQDKVKQSGQILKQSTVDTIKLLWQFKWYIVGYLIYYSMFIVEYLKPPAADDNIFHAEATSQIWSYTNQEVYIGSLRLEIIILSLLFLLGTSNMRNHPRLAKIIFASPWIVMLLGIIVIICEWLWGLLS